jgi:hypothetical protein
MVNIPSSNRKVNTIPEPSYLDQLIAEYSKTHHARVEEYEEACWPVSYAETLRGGARTMLYLVDPREEFELIEFMGVAIVLNLNPTFVARKLMAMGELERK